MSETSAITTVVHVAQIVPVTEAEGPGKRFALWLQGCPLRCLGCCNPEMLSFSGGQETKVADVLAQIQAAIAHGIEGITLLGGEPFAHAALVTPLAARVRAWGLSVMVFSGYTLEEIDAMGEPAARDLLAQTDILVDGPYRRDLPETRRRWLGSTNQRVHFLSHRCDPADPRWLMRNTLEIRLNESALTVNGFPARSARPLWRRPGSLHPKGQA